MYPLVIYECLLSKEQICSCVRVKEGNGADIAGRVGELKGIDAFNVYIQSCWEEVCVLFIRQITVQLGFYKCSRHACNLNKQNVVVSQVSVCGEEGAADAV